MSNKVQIVSQQVPSNFCPITNDNWQSLVSLLSGTFSGDPGINFGNAVPSPINRNNPWFRLNTDNTPDRWYVFAQGAWLAAHTMFTGAIIEYTGALADLDTLDGGEAGAVTSISGPMWQQATEFNAKFPLGVGTLPSAVVVSPLGAGGEETHKLTADELAQHQHLLINTGTDASSGTGALTLTPDNFITRISTNQTNGLGYLLQGQQIEPTIGLSGATSSAETPHNNLPPYVGTIFLRKSARRFYRINA